MFVAEVHEDATFVSRRTVVKGAVAGAAVGLAGFPFIGRAQSDVIRIGHLTPRTGFLGPLGELEHLPAAILLDIDLPEGLAPDEVTIDVVEGDTLVQTGSGDLAAEHLLGEARLKSGSGDVLVRRAESALVVAPALNSARSSTIGAA